MNFKTLLHRRIAVTSSMRHTKLIGHPFSFLVNSDIKVVARVSNSPYGVLFDRYMVIEENDYNQIVIEEERFFLNILSTNNDIFYRKYLHDFRKNLSCIVKIGLEDRKNESEITDIINEYNLLNEL